MSYGAAVESTIHTPSRPATRHSGQSSAWVVSRVPASAARATAVAATKVHGNAYVFSKGAGGWRVVAMLSHDPAKPLRCD